MVPAMCYISYDIIRNHWTCFSYCCTGWVAVCFLAYSSWTFDI